MASKIDVSALTLNTEEATQIGEAVIEQVFVQGELTDVHAIETGVQHDQQIVFVDNLDVSGEAYTNCTPVEQTGLVLTEKKWQPALVGGRYTHCANDLNQLLKLFKKSSKANPDFFDNIDSEAMGLLMAKIIDAMKVSISAKVWLGDLTAAVQAGGNFTIAGFNVGLWDQIEGLWEQIFADSAIPRFTITENAGATYVLQVLASGKGRTIFQTMYEDADSRLIGHPDAEYLVTRSIWDNYLTTIEDKQGNGGVIERLESGVVRMKYRGIPIIRMDEWDRTIRKYQDDLTVHYRPHRALLTVPNNIPIATLSTDDLDSLESWYERKDKTNILDFSYFLDAKWGESYMGSVAY